MIIPRHRVPGAEQQAEVFAEIALAPKIQRRIAPVLIRILSLRKQLAAQRDVRPEVPLHQPAAVGMIALARRGI